MPLLRWLRFFAIMYLPSQRTPGRRSSGPAGFAANFLCFRCCQAVVAEPIHRLFLLDRPTRSAANYILVVDLMIGPTTAGRNQPVFFDLKERRAIYTFSFHITSFCQLDRLPCKDHPQFRQTELCNTQLRPVQCVSTLRWCLLADLPEIC